MIRVFDNDTGRELGEITQSQLQFLIDKLEEESLEDQDYYLNRATIEMLEREGGDPGLIEMLRGALGDGEGVEIRWSRG
ncbi:MAG TPA: galactosyldiacylglycerol synthase [Patescibacteria group bacterium]|nr:galactosyldiacylglycerol synthase [Patescibacteria group bacterium]